MSPQRWPDKYSLTRELPHQFKANNLNIIYLC